MHKITHHHTVAAALGAVALFSACATTTTANRDGAAPNVMTISAVTRGEKKPARLSHDVVLADELRRVPATNTYTALERTRPSFLRVRGASAAMRHQAPEIDVFLNGQYAGGAEVLRSVPSEFVQRIQLVQRSQGYVTYGPQLRGEHALFITLVNK
jgi:hypothetical protein